ncbi:uncharacterized protein LOC105183887 isoform X1 [Harpegnathos saltator]|uniref:uncharacterized protein LOC105183887 isoform X1 n=1 Tax=Harpegnathos saltator TaxID=610380 RepID=UPI000DBEEDB2|nr:uncharacterized protein LOC105183887 isoform X1 [Harpegnathos saltator]
MDRCSIKCPKVKQQLRARITERPSLADRFFPQRKAVAPRLLQDPASRDIPRRDEPRRAVEPIEKPMEQEDEEIELTEERELMIERTTIEEDGVVEDGIDWAPTQRDEAERVIRPADAQEPRVLEEASIAERSIATPMDSDGETVDEVETRTAVVDKTLIPVHEEVETDQPKDAEGQLSQDKPARRVEHREEEEDELVDEGLPKSQPAVNAKETPQEETPKTLRRERIPLEDAEAAGPSVAEERQPRVADGRGVVGDSTTRAAAAAASEEDACDETCPLVQEQKGELLIRRRETLPGGSAPVLSNAVVLIFPLGKVTCIYTRVHTHTHTHTHTHVPRTRIHHFTAAIRLLQNALCANWRNGRGS